MSDADRPVLGIAVSFPRERLPWRASSLLAALALLAMAASARVAAAADDEVVDRIEAEQQDLQVVFARGNANIDLAAQIDANIFQPQGDAAAARPHVDACFRVRFDEIDRECGLSEPQRQKLWLAAAGDASRFFSDVAKVRRQYEGKTLDQRDPNAFGAAWQEMWQQIQPLRMKFQGGLFGASSLFSKSIDKTLTPDQMARYRALLDSRTHFRRQAAALATVNKLEEAVPLDNSQHEAMLKLLLDNVDNFPQPNLRGFKLDIMNQSEYWLAQLPADKIQPILDERQWQQFQQKFLGQAGGQAVNAFFVADEIIDEEMNVEEMIVDETIVEEMNVEESVEEAAPEE